MSEIMKFSSKIPVSYRMICTWPNKDSKQSLWHCHNNYSYWSSPWAALFSPRKLSGLLHCSEPYLPLMGFFITISHFWSITSNLNLDHKESPPPLACFFIPVHFIYLASDCYTQWQSHIAGIVYMYLFCLQHCFLFCLTKITSINHSQLHNI